MIGRPILTPQQKMERQIRMIDQFLDQSAKTIIQSPIPAKQEDRTDGKSR